jgi:CHAT domain
MKVLFVASNPDTSGSLNLQVEITALQAAFMSESVEPISFAFLPSLEVERLPEVVRNFKPDILHISAHASAKALSLANQYGSEVVLTAKTLATFLPMESPPRLVYLNACNSKEIAKSLAEVVPMAIGTTDTISNHAARSSAVSFYQLLLKGSSVQSAFAVCQQMIEGLTASEVSAEIYHRADIEPAKEIMHSRPVLVADFRDGKPKSSKGAYWFQLGLMNCPPGTTQIVFTSDDGSLIWPMMSLQDSLCLVVRPLAPAQVVWSSHQHYWTADHDHRLFAVGIKIEGRPYNVSATLCEAVENWYHFRMPRKTPAEVTRVLAGLRTAYL